MPPTECLIYSKQKKLLVKKPAWSDISSLVSLYQSVSLASENLARTKDEITFSYLETIWKRSAENGLQFIAIDVEESNQIVAEIHAYKPIPNVFAHVLSEMTFVVETKSQGQGIGRQLLRLFVHHLTTERTDIHRIELFVKAQNHKAIQLYQEFDFKIEGRFLRRLGSGIEGVYQDDIAMAWLRPFSQTK